MSSFLSTLLFGSQSQPQNIPSRNRSQSGASGGGSPSSSSSLLLTSSTPPHTSSLHSSSTAPTLPFTTILLASSPPPPFKSHGVFPPTTTTTATSNTTTSNPSSNSSNNNNNMASSSSSSSTPTTPNATTPPLILTFSPPLSNKQWIGREVELSQYIFKLSHNPLSFRMDDHFIQEMEMQRHERSGLIHPQHPYHFDQYYSLSQVNTLRMYDINLNSMYSILVPKYVDDITFWKSYFYCIHRILYTDCIEELDEEICELYNKRRRQQMERELELQEYCNAIESDCKYILTLIEIENENVHRILKKEQELANRVIEEIDRQEGRSTTIMNETTSDPSSHSIRSEMSGVDVNNGGVTSDHDTNTHERVECTQDEHTNKEASATSDQPKGDTPLIAEMKTSEESSMNTTNTTTILNENNTNSTQSPSSPSTEQKTNHQKIEEKIREVIEIKKKLSLLSSEVITNETLIERIAQCNHCFMTTFTEYTRYKDLLKELPDSHPLYGTSVGGKLNICSHSSFSPLLLKTNRTHPITTEFQRKKIVSILPARFHLSNWVLLYSTLEHGISLRTLYRNTQNVDQSILIIKTMDGQVLGAFNPVPLNEFGNKYYGSGEIFLYSFKNNTTLRVFRWSKLNEFFMRSNDFMICYGGDEVGRSALMIHEDLTTGSTNICLTFDNMEDGPLLEKVNKESNNSESKPGMVRSQSITTFSTEVEFEIYALEIWGFEEHTKKASTKKVSSAKSSFIDYTQY